jgi:hypothetical protein
MRQKKRKKPPNVGSTRCGLVGGAIDIDERSCLPQTSHVTKESEKATSLLGQVKMF